MENPKLIEQISKMARESDGGDHGVSPSDNDVGIRETTHEIEKPKDTVEATEAVAPIRDMPHARRSRGELLCALKPYVSKERAQAIDSMLSIVEILDVMKGGR